MSVTARSNRQNLQSVALRLFCEQGYESTTVADVAKAAGVSHMTFFRHFPTKESVVVGDIFDPALAAAVAAQPEDMALNRAVHGIVAAMSSPEAREELSSVAFKSRVRLIADTPSLRGAALASSTATQDALYDALVVSGSGAEEARAAAGAVMGAATAILLDWATTSRSKDAALALRQGLNSLLWTSA